MQCLAPGLAAPLNSPGQDSMQARVERNHSAPENDGLSPPSAALCRCPRPKRGDGFALCRIVC